MLMCGVRYGDSFPSLVFLQLPHTSALRMTLTYLIFVYLGLSLDFPFVDLFVCFSLHHILFNLSSVAVHLIPDQWVVNESHFQIFLLLFISVIFQLNFQIMTSSFKKFHLTLVGVQTNLQIILKETSFKNAPSRSEQHFSMPVFHDSKTSPNRPRH